MAGQSVEVLFDYHSSDRVFGVPDRLKDLFLTKEKVQTLISEVTNLCASLDSSIRNVL